MRATLVAVVLIVSSTPCCICRVAVGDDQDLVGFSSFVENQLDPMRVFSDAVAHRACFDGHPLASAALARASEAGKMRGGAGRACSCCGESTAGHESFFLPFLSADPAEPAYEFNYAGVHQACFANREFARRFRAAVEGFMSSGRWRSVRKLEFTGDTPRWVLPATHRLVVSRKS